MRTLISGPQWAVVAILLAALPTSILATPFPTVEPAQLQAQKPIVYDVRTRSPGHLHGRFMHVTDFHPDRFYKTYSSTGEDSACHRSSGSAGYYGAETTDCDSPVTLVNATFDWLAEHVKDEIDFIIWTGDSARHDNDEELPRNNKQIKDLNALIVAKFEEVFGRERDNDDPYDDYTVPIAPNLGNNDILPHNIFDLGPNEWTRTYLDLWKSFIPEEERHEFDQSGWYAVDVIPNYLTVFSLNTLYFYDKNAAVDGCSLRSEPGYRQMEWLRVQLQFLRIRGMKAMIIGHVPPARTEGKINWDETCWQKYALWMRQYRDVVVGTFYGHMNIDHFIVQDFDDINDSLEDGVGIEEFGLENKKKQWEITKQKEANGEVEVKSASSYIAELRSWWAQLPKKPKSMKSDTTLATLERSHPNLDKPAHAVSDMSDDARPDWEIDALVKKGGKGNKGKKGKKGKKDKKKRPKDRHGREKNYLRAIGGDYAERFSVSFVSPSVIPNYYPTFRIYEYNITGVDYRPPTMDVARPKMDWDALGLGSSDLEAMKKKKKKSNKKRRFTVPEPPPRGTPPGPAYSPQTLSLLGYTQWYANLTHINNDFKSSDAQSGKAIYSGGWKDGKHGHHNGKKPRQDGKPDPKKFKFEVLYDTMNDTVYKVKDLTVRNYVELAQRMSTGVQAVQQDGQGDVDVLKKGKEEVNGKKGKGKGKGEKNKQRKNKVKKGKMNKVWHAFLQRAFVGTMTDQEIEEEFGG
ncbi:Metallo-dependent phosphatase-like protein [Elsinoe ampelina]|uniref:Endopolyphosphatase n=1 Tax=Elsinoe ampelina TaxID=302913 RepID=A0A6A6GB30_9PEZI|nr:Metallo-dependent phosphatase-like protein [Elsinoe ampelina]